jgi:AcrR family transcriptional regulator
MGVSRQQAAENRRAIVTAAGRLFRERGVDGVGIADLMKAAGFTQGGFYNHFQSKDALVAAVMEKAIKDGAANLVAAIERTKTYRKYKATFHASAPHRRRPRRPAGVAAARRHAGARSGQAPLRGGFYSIAKGILHAQRDERHLRCAHVANEPTHNGVGLGNSTAIRYH